MLSFKFLIRQRERFICLTALASAICISTFSFGQTIDPKTMEKYVQSSCAVMAPLMTTSVMHDALNVMVPGSFSQGSNLVEYLRVNRKDFYLRLTKIAAEYDFDSLEEWALIADRVTIIRLAAVAPPEAYNIERSPKDTVILPGSNSLAVQTYLTITELVSSVTEEEKRMIAPYLATMNVSCFDNVVVN